MDDYSRQERRRGSNRARERQMARKRRRDSLTKIVDQSTPRIRDKKPPMSSSIETVRLLLRDFIWLLVGRALVLKLMLGLLVVFGVLFVGSYMLSGRIFPNVYVMGMDVGDMTVEEASDALATMWQEDVMITLTMGGQIMNSVMPSDLGLSIDTQQIAQSAKAVGMSGIPFGTSVTPIASVDYAMAQTYLLDMTEQIYEPPFEAGYEWREGELVAVPGRAGKQLDISLTLERLQQDPAGIVQSRRLDLMTIDLLPTVMDAAPFLDEAYAFLTSDIKLEGFDPYSHETIEWAIDTETAATWLASGENGLTVREDVYIDYIQMINNGLVNSESPRYLDEQHSLEKLQESLRTSDPNVLLRVRYLPQPYEIEQRDNGFLIGRKNGIPFQLISEANPAVEWNQLSIGQQIQIPSRDALIPEDPIANKRIVVDLESQWLIAFENEEIVFSWGISSGRETAPTYPGVFQILTHEDTAYGSSYTLCGEGGTDCGQWEMYWFMGVYEVVPGLMNGFHGAVLLPNGGYLGGGGVYSPSTFGCVMSLNANAQNLYEWAEIGTIVEIIDKDFQPESELGRKALEFIDTIDTSYRPTSA
jgi:lipoprotein-anchoring transpeptidase ErfK/SrfK